MFSIHVNGSVYTSIYPVPFPDDISTAYGNKSSQFIVDYLIEPADNFFDPYGGVYIRVHHVYGPNYGSDAAFIKKCLDSKNDPKGKYRITFKIVFVPNPGATEVSAKEGKGALDFSDYEVAKKYFGIKD